MKTITEKLADALRTIDEHCQTGLNSSVYSHWSAALEDAMRLSRDALAAYDAQRAVPPSDGTWHVEDYAVSSGEVGVCIKKGDDTVLDLPFMPAWPESTQRARAARIVACVNACQGMTTAEVESFGSPGELGRCAQLWVSDDGEEVTP